MKCAQRNWSLLLFSCLGINLGLMGSAHAAPKLIEACEACHSTNMVSQVPSYPILHGQKQGYLEKQLEAFRDGTRENPMMAGLVQNLSDSDITELAQHYSQQTFVKEAKQASDRRGADVRARCVSCHGLSGNTVNTEWPNLLGQNHDYIFNQLNKFASGERKSVIMEQIANELTLEQRKQVALYYDQQGRTQ
ncbi:hypothetical protein [Photobacterium rosenbergii]|uniref:Cytochrome c domain-containing protein n=1 Tax=Photobacterium rosenbergii TaxID=294936 RepID=A0ABU3ZJK2_9GAMM|nr:hypothetical protein [Photobacterium rosenbergii]MDV5170187.1 hypothetical protein [Photobacterium rosenbergii]